MPLCLGEMSFCHSDKDLLQLSSSGLEVEKAIKGHVCIELCKLVWSEHCSGVALFKRLGRCCCNLPFTSELVVCRAVLHWHSRLLILWWWSALDGDSARQLLE